MTIPHMDWGRTVQIDIAGMLVVIDPEVEMARAVQYRPLLYRWGQYAAQVPYPRHLYPAAPQNMRCYDAAFALSMEFLELSYVEGLLHVREGDRVVSIGHGWCEAHDGFVVDPTMSKNQHIGSLAYEGISLNKAYVMHQYQKFGYIGVLDGSPYGEAAGVYFDDPHLWLGPVCQHI